MQDSSVSKVLCLLGTVAGAGDDTLAVDSDR